MSKKKKHEEHIDETWLIPYSDLLTLLLALFIVLFAMSSVDAEKFKQMAIAFNEELKGGTGKEQFLNETKPSSEENLSDQEQAEAEKLAELAKAEAEKQKEMEELKQLQQQIEGYIAGNNLSLSLKTTLTERGLMVTIMDNALFDSGKADVKPESSQIAGEIAQLLKAAIPREVMISGHTDNVPISNPRYPSNWDLSADRALNFMKVLMDAEASLPRDKFSAIGYGEYRPVADNATPEGKATNRRVEVLILPLTETQEAEQAAQ